MDAVLVIGRILFAFIFITSGIAHFAKLEMMTGYAKYKKLPAAKLGVIASGLFFLLGGIYIALGFWVDLGALMLAITLVLAAVIFHNYWKETDLQRCNFSRCFRSTHRKHLFLQQVNSISYKALSKTAPRDGGRFAFG